ncbi:LacI family DNA-binding transcriptional regulator [Myceligenerans indicum]|uniref:LacI family transcriptional regulator n=1 Tax=Myceligenerans indicum TaxID=2593663 RepID=A0ABS1LFV9_9MICO|nr:LacI family DNA-binding transcriptional regulator [Myceligenerans indicum]MBL0885119.1 LacI family transcriptional regulator [Myceligenerans indicum]
MERARRATLKDVARVSGVSPTTVSFVLNDTPGQTIPADTRAKVFEAARSLDYSPHRLARALREGSSRVVLLKLGDLRPGHSMDGFVTGMRHELSRHGHTLVVHPGGAGPALMAEFVATLAPRAVVDLAGPYQQAATDGNGNDGGWVDGLAAHTMTQLAHLATRGHSQIALALPDEAAAEPLAGLRLRHAREAWSQLGSQELHPLHVPATAHEAAGAVRTLRVHHPQVTAVAAFDDETALRVLAAMADAGLAAPADLAVIGFDDGPYGALWRPTLTSVHIDGESFGRRAAREALGIDPGAPVTPASTVVQRQSA